MRTETMAPEKNGDRKNMLIMRNILKSKKFSLFGGNCGLH